MRQTQAVSFRWTLVPFMACVLVGCGVQDFDSGTSTKPKRDPAGSGSSASATAEKVLDLSVCGFDLSKPTTLTTSRRLTMDSFKRTADTSILGGLFPMKTEVTFSGTLVIEGSLSGLLVSGASSALPAIDNTEVNVVLNDIKGASEIQVLDAAMRGKIGEAYPDWTGLFCTLQPAKQFTSNGANHIVVEFSQPIPFGVLTLASLGRMKTELATKRTFSKVTAKVIKSDNVNVAVGTLFEGSVIAGEVPVATLTGAKGDFAITITYNFGGKEKNKLLGLPMAMSWYIDSTTKTLTSVQVQSNTDLLTSFR
ncbi:MAG: hypothetical protein NTV34_12655 [Proteobacteria bacterium]|nr:hypothetical protein [Pseudomonadota bacterium]